MVLAGILKRLNMAIQFQKAVIPCGFSFSMVRVITIIDGVSTDFDQIT